MTSDHREFRQLGQTGLRVSAFGMGCGNFGGVGSAPEFFGRGESEEEAFLLLDRAVDLGINFFDTADAYGGGRSEATIGRWLATKDGTVRDRLLISSKVGNAVGDGPNQRGLSRRHILRQVDASLTRLGVDHLDMYLIHEPDPTTPLEETMGVLDDIVRAGKVRSIGASNLAAWQVMKSLWISAERGLHRFEWVQNSFNLLERSDQSSMLAVCRDQGLGFTPFSPLCGGLLTGKYDLGTGYPTDSRMSMRPEPYLRFWNEATFARIDRLASAASDLGVSTAGLALAWVRHHPDITATLVGPRRPGHFEAVEEAMGLDLSDSEWVDIGSWFSEDDAPSTP
jgi:aryl-alcohol dehydrogenase-like predicted oxidoreductase